MYQPLRTTLAATALAVLAAAAVPGALAPVGTGAHAEGAGVPIRPAEIDRGPDVRGPHLDRHTLVDGDVRIRVRGHSPRLVGKVSSGYVVQTLGRNGRAWVTKRVAPGEGTTRLFAGVGPDALVASEADELAVVSLRSRRRTIVGLRSATTGAEVTSRRFRGVVDVLAVDGPKVVLGGDRIGTAVWRADRSKVRRISPQKGYLADLDANRLATFTGDPFDGGCARVTPLRKPARTLWRSCRERVAAFSPKGGRIATIGILADGLGPNVVVARSIDGDRLARYRVGSHFGALRWETERRLLLDSYGREVGATVRCRVRSCERAGRLSATPGS